MIPALRIDARGRRCPQPVIDLAHGIRDVAVGEVVELVADDPVAAVDIPAWCWTQRHEFLGSAPTDEPPGAEPAGAATAYLVRRLS